MRKTTIPSDMNRRSFVKATGTALAALPLLSRCGSGMTRSKVALLKSSNRTEAVHEILSLLDFPTPRGKKVLVKPNFNTADPTPGSTHNDTLSQLVKELRERKCSSLSVGDRSGPQPMEKVVEIKNIERMAKELDFDFSDFGKLPAEEWLHHNPEGNHWEEGFELAKPALAADYLATTYCLKTHQYGGVFTLSLKLTVGMAPRKLMRQLHGSPNMRKMIAELNQPFSPQLLLMDGVEAFVDGGPMTGTLKKADVFLAGTDRIAMDAAALAILKELGANDAIMKTNIFEQEQITRAVELGLGVSNPEQIQFITGDRVSKNYAAKVREILLQG